MSRTTPLCTLLAAFCLSALIAQDQPPAAAAGGRGGRDRGPVKEYWVEKTAPAIYVPPNKPLTKLADLKAKHPGQSSWSELIVKDPEHQAVYNSAAPGTKFRRSLHPDTPEIMVVVAGEMHVNIE